MSNKLTTAEVRDWLNGKNRDRQWLADTLGVSKRTVDNWFSEGDLPLFASQHIRRILCEEASPAHLRFTLEQWDRIEAARLMAGYTDRTEFFTDALTQYAEGVVGKVPEHIEKLGSAAVARYKLARLISDLQKDHEKAPAPETHVSDAPARPAAKRRKA